MANTRYGFVRSYQSMPGGLDYYKQLASSGLGGVLFASNDPYLQQAMDIARQAGLQAGIWVPEGVQQQGDATGYANYLGQLSKNYNPSLLVPDIEATGKGTPGSSQWLWNETVAKAYRALAPNQATAVTVMPNQDDFNYGAWTSRGAPIWAQAYGTTLDQQFDPAQVVQRLVANGVPANMAMAVLAAGQQPGGYGGNYATYTLDDLAAMGIQPTPNSTPADLETVPPGAEPPSGQGGGTTIFPNKGGRTVQSSTPGAPDGQGYSIAGEMYAKHRLQQMVNAGLIPELPEPGPGGYSAVWRSISGNLSPQAQAAGFNDPGFYLRQAGQQHTMNPHQPGVGPQNAGLMYPQGGAVGANPFLGGVHGVSPGAVTEHRSMLPGGGGGSLSQNNLGHSLVDAIRQKLAGAITQAAQHTTLRRM